MQSSDYSNISYKFSVLMPVYFKEKPINLQLSLKSIIEDQTLKPSEIVLVKDGYLSPDLERVISDYTSKYPSLFNIIALKKNLGLGKALRIGVEACSYEFIARADSDDISLPNRFILQIPLLNEYDVVGANITEFEGDPTEIRCIRKVPERHEQIRKFAIYRSPVNHPAVAYKKSAVINSGNYMHMPGFEDYFLFARMLMKGYKFYNIQIPLVLFRADNMIARRRGFSYLKNEISFLKELYKIGFISYPQSLFNMSIRCFVRLLPPMICRAVYTNFFRSKEL